MARRVVLAAVLAIVCVAIACPIGDAVYDKERRRRTPRVGSRASALGISAGVGFVSGFGAGLALDAVLPVTSGVPRGAPKSAEPSVRITNTALRNHSALFIGVTFLLFFLLSPGVLLNVPMPGPKGCLAPMFRPRTRRHHAREPCGFAWVSILNVGVHALLFLLCVASVHAITLRAAVRP